MFQQLSDRLKHTFDKLAGRGRLTEEDIKIASRDIRMALLEADVALPVVKRVMNLVKERALGEEVIKSIRPDQQIVKVVNDCLIEVLGEGEELNLRAQPPVVILMTGLQGSGKTTTTGKLAKYLKEKQNKKVMLASLDIYRPAAQEQLQTLAERTGTLGLEIIKGQKPVEIAKRAIDTAKKSAVDVLFLDTAGRLEIDEELMAELKAVKEVAQPTETLLVADSLTGQVAVKVADTFNQEIGVTGICLTRVDGDGRGGAALSMREVTGQPIKFIGTGEGMDAISPFHPDRVANRILGMGDVVSLVEKAQEVMGEEEAMKTAEKMSKGIFTMEDLRSQLKQIQKMGSMESIMNMMPGMGGMKNKMDPSKLDDKVIVHQVAIIDSMTKQERKNPSLLNMKRKRRIAKGAGVSVNDINKLMKQYQQMQKMMKMVKKMGMGGMMNMMGKIPGMPKMPKI